jgi:hypothetical protein
MQVELKSVKPYGMTAERRCRMSKFGKLSLLAESKRMAKHIFKNPACYKNRRETFPTEQDTYEYKIDERMRKDKIYRKKI